MTWNVWISRISYQSANPRDMVAFASSLEMIPYDPARFLENFRHHVLKKIYGDMDPLEDVTELILQIYCGRASYCTERRRDHPGRL